MLFEQVNDVFHERSVDQGDHRLGHADGQRVNAGAEASRHDDSFQYSLLKGIKVRSIIFGEDVRVLQAVGGLHFSVRRDLSF